MKKNQKNDSRVHEAPADVKQRVLDARDNWQKKKGIRARQGFFKEVFSILREVVTPAPDDMHDFYYVLGPGDKDGNFSAAWYLPGTQENTYRVQEDAWGLRLVCDNPMQRSYERKGACPLQLCTDQHKLLLQNLVTELEVPNAYRVFILRIPREWPYSRAFRKGVCPADYREFLPFVGLMHFTPAS